MPIGKNYINKIMTKKENRISWVAAIISAVIMLQTLYFKFSASPESVYIFTVLGLEPYGRIGIGIFELIASVLLFIPRTRIFGAIIGVGLMAGACFSHLTKLGIVVLDDGGYLFALCIIVLSLCLVILYIERDKIQTTIRSLLPFKSS